MSIAYYCNGAALSPHGSSADGQYWVRRSLWLELARRFGKINYIGEHKVKLGVDHEAMGNSFQLVNEPFRALHRWWRQISDDQGWWDPEPSYLDRYVAALPDDTEVALIEFSCSNSPALGNHISSVLMALLRNGIPTVLWDVDAWSHALPATVRRSSGLDVLSSEHPLVVTVSGAGEHLRASHHWRRFPTVRSLYYCYDPSWELPWNLESIRYNLVYCGKNFRRTPKLIKFYGGTDCFIYTWEPKPEDQPEVVALGAERFERLIPQTERCWTTYETLGAANQTGAASVGITIKIIERTGLLAIRPLDLAAAGRLALQDADCLGYAGVYTLSELTVRSSAEAVDLAQRARRDHTWLRAKVSEQRDLLRRYTPERTVDRLTELWQLAARCGVTA